MQALKIMCRDSAAYSEFLCYQALAIKENLMHKVNYLYIIRACAHSTFTVACVGIVDIAKLSSSIEKSVVLDSFRKI